MRWLVRTVVALLLLAVVAVATLWGIKLAGYGYLLAISQDPPQPVATDIPFAPQVAEGIADPDDPTNGDPNEPIDMMLVRDNGAQQAESGQFDASVTLSGDLVAGGGDDVFLYRHYVGRKEVSGGNSIDVFIDDLVSSGSSGANRSWYDGLGYALVTSALGTDGDLNDDGFVDGEVVVDCDDLSVMQDEVGRLLSREGQRGEGGPDGQPRGYSCFHRDTIIRDPSSV